MTIQPGVGYTFTASSQGENITVEKPWGPWSNYDTGETPDHPFKIVNVQIATSGGSQVVRFQVQSGTINNLVPKMNDYVSSTDVLLNRVTSGVADPPTEQLASSNYDATTKTSYITLRAGAKTTSPFDYPDSVFSSNQYPVIIGGNTFPVTPDNNVWGFLVIGTIAVDNITTPTTFTVSQNVTGSLWADRIKLAGITARYYYARI